MTPFDRSEATHIEMSRIERETYKPAGYAEYETRTSLRDLITIYGIEGARQLVADIFKDEARRSAR